jgi:23S rRNA (cytosine1962-C5)-methyltransferase
MTSISDDQAPAGTLAVVFDTDRKFAAIGLWDPNSPIRLRILHAGSPRKVDAEFWRSKVARAAAIRAPLAAQGTTGWRFFHGENDGMGGLVVDRYDSTLVCKVYSAAWLPHLNDVLEALREAEQPERIVIRLARLASDDPAFADAGLTDGMVVLGDPPDGPVMFSENGLSFEANVLMGQKTGHFLDQRENRQFIRQVSAGARVLDVFSCTGGFSVHAAAGGATAVHSVDLAAPAIEAAKRNMAHNSAETSGTRHVATVGDAFEVMERLGRSSEHYDIVIIDPPSFASKASESDRALRAYRKLAELGLPLVTSGGRLLQASCSSRVTEDDLISTVHAAIKSQGRTRSREQVFGHALDHPVAFRQGRYLKAVSCVLS